MALLVVRHKVNDFDAWKPVFDEHGAARAASGCKGGRLYCSSDDPKEVVILFRWDNHANARKFTESADLRDAMTRAGVADAPDFYFLNRVEEFSQ